MPVARGRPPASKATPYKIPGVSLGCDQLQIGAPLASTSTIQVSVGLFIQRATSTLPEGATAAAARFRSPFVASPSSASAGVEINCPDGSNRCAVITAGPSGED